MLNSIVLRLSLLVALILAVAFMMLMSIVYRSTSTQFVEAHKKILSSGKAEYVETLLVGDLQHAYEAGGWLEVNKFVSAGELQDSSEIPSFVAVDLVPRVRVTTEPMLELASVGKTAEGDIFITLRTDRDGKENLVEIADNNPRKLLDSKGKVFGEIVLLPTPLGENEGTQFANKVWRAAGLWLLVVVILAMASVAVLLRHALAPIDKLKRAAQDLQSGEIPAPISNVNSTEFAGLVAAFNSASQAIAKTESIRRGLITDVAHELRTPVTNIRAQVEAFQSGLIAPDTEFSATLQAEARVLERLIDDFQQLAVSDAGQLRLNLQTIPLREATESILNVMADAAGADLDINVPDGFLVSVDEERLRQVLGNLFENSARHTTGPLFVTISAHADGGFAVIDFEDNGPGVAKSDQPYIFGRFYRAEKSRNRSTGGSGLGLTIVKGILEAMGGRIEYVDTAESGATFRFTLPLVSA